MKNKKIFKLATATLISTGLVIPNITYTSSLVAKAESSKTYFNRGTSKVGDKVLISGVISSEPGVFGGQGFYINTDNGGGIYVYPEKNVIPKDSIHIKDAVSFEATITEYNGAIQLTQIQNFKKLSNSEVVYSNLKLDNIPEKNLDTTFSLSNITISDIKSQGKFKNTVFTATDKNGNSIEVFIDNRVGANYDKLKEQLKDENSLSSVQGVLTKFKNKYQLKVTDLTGLIFNQISKEENQEKDNSLQLKNIGELQGASHISPLINKEVTIKDVVVTKIDNDKGFYVQDIKPDNDTKTSDAVYVVSKEKVSVGDLLKIKGIVNENTLSGYAEKDKTDLTVTQLISSKIEKLGTSKLPTPIKIANNIPRKNIDDDNLTKFEPEKDAIDFWESIEAMRVEIAKPTILGPQKYGYLYVLPEDYKGLERNNAGGISLQSDGNNTEIIPLLTGQSKFRAKANDKFSENIIGNVTYDYSEYKVDVRGQKLPEKIDGKLQRENSNINFDESKLTVASYNIENFSANNSKKETPEEKVEKIANSFIHQINKPDIISLIEVQDNNGTIDDGTTSGVKSGERLAQKIKELGGPNYKYVEIAPENNADGGAPGGNIRVAYLYNSERVKLVEKEIANANEPAKFVNGSLEKNPARISPNSPAFANSRKSLVAEFDFNGEKVIVINNHLSSKRGDSPLYGKEQPAIEHSSVSRLKQAEEIRNFVASGLKQNPNLKFVLTGDFNDYEFSKTILELEKNNYLANLMSRHDLADRYSYFYRGNQQSLDNILVSTNILKNVIFDAIHVNSSFMEEDGRASDHDPLLIQISFDKKEENKKENITTGKDSEKEKDNENKNKGIKEEQSDAINKNKTEDKHSIKESDTLTEKENTTIQEDRNNKNEDKKENSLEDIISSDKEIKKEEQSFKKTKEKIKKKLANTGLDNASTTAILILTMSSLIFAIRKKLKNKN